MEVDEEWAPTVRAAFRAITSEGSLANAARWLNEQGFRMKSTRDGGGIRTRLGYFTVRNLGSILRLKFYTGVKCYKQGLEIKETEAVWPQIIDRETFDRANAILNKNHRRNKDNMQDRYPYQLSGLVFCKKCGDRMIGKSAHGATCKVGYYEHAFNTISGANVPELQKTCVPIRVQAMILEPALWNEIINLFQDETFAQELLKYAKRAHQLNPGSKEAQKNNQVIFNVDRQLEVLAERLSTLPETISPTPIYRQMEKLEEKKREAQGKISRMQSDGFVKDEPCSFHDYHRFLKAVSDLLRRDDNHKIRMKVIRLLVHKINILPDGFEAHFRVGESYVKVFLIKYTEYDSKAKNAPLDTSGASKENLHKENVLPEISSGNAAHFLGHFSSNTCISGARVEQVDEHPINTCATFIFELEDYPEAKVLSRDELKHLYARLKSYKKVAEHIGASEAFVRQTCQNKKYKNQKRKKA